MKINNTHYRTIWPVDPQRPGAVRVIDQTSLPFAFKTIDLATAEDAARTIKTMIVRGAPLIGATAAYGVALAMQSDPSDENLQRSSHLLLSTRPTEIGRAHV
mgnify:CR=1 FL=1